MEPRFTKPTGANPYYIRKPSGYSGCVLGNNSRGQRDPVLNVLPNCVGWAIGRFNEVGDYGCIKYGFKGNACNFINSAKDMGLTITQEPTQGGIMVWSGGSGAGHVAFVEQLNKDGSASTSESEWNGKVFSTYRRSGASWTDGCYWMKTKYTYLGCIKNPAVEDEPEGDEVITDITIKDAKTGDLVVLKGIYKDGHNYIQLSDLAEHNFAGVGWDGKYPVLTPIKKCECLIYDK